LKEFFIAPLEIDERISLKPLFLTWFGLQGFLIGLKIISNGVAKSSQGDTMFLSYPNSKNDRY